jgi:hypothetical protein
LAAQATIYLKSGRNTVFHPYALKKIAATGNIFSNGLIETKPTKGQQFIIKKIQA